MSRPRPRSTAGPTTHRPRPDRTLTDVYRFALRPKWILSHLFVVALAAAMISLGFWQLRRLDQKKDANRVVRARMSEPVADVGALLAVGDPYSAATDLVDRPVRTVGTWLGSEQVLVRGRSLDSIPGSWVLTPLRRSDGSLVIVNRGWIPNSGTYDAVPPQYVPPAGPVTVTGLLQPTAVRQGLGPVDPPGRRLTSLARADIARYAEQLDAPVVPAWVQLQTTSPASSTSARVPRVLGPPALDEGPHFSYAMQWFIFSTIAIVGYPLILRRNAREKALEALGPATFVVGEARA